MTDVEIPSKPTTAFRGKLIKSYLMFILAFLTQNSTQNFLIEVHNHNFFRLTNPCFLIFKCLPVCGRDQNRNWFDLIASNTCQHLGAQFWKSGPGSESGPELLELMVIEWLAAKAKSHSDLPSERLKVRM
jgi:hypothetical protein